MCITSLAPTAPLVAPFATLYYMIFIPMLRWLHIFVYRPTYDAGGARFPIYHDIIISSLILGQLLIAASLLLKQSVVSSFIVFVMVFPTFLFSHWTKEQFQRSYMDAGLLQTSQLDGWGVARTMEDREKYRRWLVDCHKAAYVPICLSGGEDFLTSQPAVTVPTYRDLAQHEDEEGKEEEDTFVDAQGEIKPSTRPGLERWKRLSPRFSQNTSQKGAVFDRYFES
jgi:Calcium-dependent channel, 7TM region, putative phosphate